MVNTLLNSKKPKVFPNTTFPDSLLGKPFNNILWRRLLSNTLNEIATNSEAVDVICPFGFEVTNNKDFLSLTLRRFYCYIGISQKSLYPENIESKFAEALLRKLEKLNSQMYKDIVSVVTAIDDQLHVLVQCRPADYTCQPNDKVICLEVRTVKSNILEDYADYIFTCLDAVYARKAEFKTYASNKMARCRLYQVYIMLENLFAAYLPPLSALDKKYYRNIFSLLDNKIQDLYTNVGMTPLTHKEQEIIIELIDKRVKQMIDTITTSKNNSNAITITTRSFHSKDQLELTVPADLYHTIKNKIINTYLDYI